MAQEEQLVFVPFTPLAYEKMQPNFDADSERERAIHSVGHQPRDVVARRRHPDEPFHDRSDSQFETFDVLFWSQLHEWSVGFPMPEKIGLQTLAQMLPRAMEQHPQVRRAEVQHATDDVTLDFIHFP